MKPGSVFNPFNTFIGAFIPNCILQNSDLSPSAKLVYARLLQFAGRNGTAWPYQATLAKEVCLSLDTVGRILKELKNYGLIRVDPPSGTDRLTHRPWIYRFLWHPIFDQELPDSAPDGCPVRSPDETTVPYEENHLEENTLSAVADATLPTARPKHPRWKKMAASLATTIQKVRKINCNGHLAQWAKSFELLHTKDGIHIPRIKKALRWYCSQLPTHSGEKFFLVIHSGHAFREKFLQLEQAIAREKAATQPNGRGCSDAGQFVRVDERGNPIEGKNSSLDYDNGDED